MDAPTNIIYKVKVPGKGIVLTTFDKAAAEKRKGYHADAKLLCVPTGER